MSSYIIERDLGYREGYSSGLEAARSVANQMYQDGYEKGLKEFRAFSDENATVYYHMTKIFKYLGVEKQPKLVDRYKQYVMDEAKSFNV